MRLPQLINQEFDADAALAAILLIVTRCPNATKHKAFKLLYFAEKLHLERYGRFIVGDDYYAMNYGPVPSRIYDAIKFAAGHGPYLSLDEPLKASFSSCLEVRGHSLTARCDPDLGKLSKSDVRCLAEAIDDYGKASFAQRTKLSHDEAWRQTPQNARVLPEKIVRTLPNAEVLLEHLSNPYLVVDDGA